MMRPELAGMTEAGSGQHFGKRHQRMTMEGRHPFRLVLDHQRALAKRILRRNAGRAAIGVAGQRLDATEGEHEAAARIDPVGAEAKHEAMSKAEMTLPAAPMRIRVRRPAPTSVL